MGPWIKLDVFCQIVIKGLSSSMLLEPDLAAGSIYFQCFFLHLEQSLPKIGFIFDLHYCRYPLDIAGKHDYSIDRLVCFPFLL